MTLTAAQTTAYTAAHRSAAAYRVPAPGWLRIAGEGRRDFVQRQTTNDVRTLMPGRALLTALTGPTARLLDVWWLLIEGTEDAGQPEVLAVIPLPGQAAQTAAYLRSRIFFMDKVTLTDASAEFAQWQIIGPGAGELLRGLGFAAQPDSDAMIAHESLRAIGPSPLIAPGTLLIAPAAEAEALAARLADWGALSLDAAAYEVLRVEAGIPAAGHELTADYTPLETNLDAAISGTKGCYTGQEVIARQVNFDKVTRRLCGLRTDRPVAPGAAVSVEGRTVGAVTSAVESPRFGPLALAVIRRPHHAPGVRVQIDLGDGRLAGGEVAALPFADPRAD